MNNNNKIFETEKIEKYFKEKNFGDTITYDELQKLTFYNLQDKYECYKFKGNTMRRVKNRLINNGIVLKAIKGIGYYILKPNQISSYTYRTYIIKPLKSYEKANIILNNTKTERLNKKELEKHKLTSELNICLMEQTNKFIRTQKYSNLE